MSTTDKNEVEVPHVYKALAEILKNLSVEKNGTLPGNMGGKPYITAVDAAAETKRQFVANGLVFLPSEEVIKHETIQFKERLNVTIVVTGTYTIVSTVDGSSVTVSGTGDGLATGTAVASNIASTNSLKNALLRTFLITEQSVEDAPKAAQNAPAGQSPAQRQIDKARAATPAAKKSDPELEALKKKVRDAIDAGVETPVGKITRELVISKQDEIKEATKKTGLELQQALVKALGV